MTDTTATVLPEGTVAVFLTLCGAPVALTQEAGTADRAVFAWECLGCGDRLHAKRTRGYARDGANSHAGECRSIPLPTSA